VRPRRLRIHHDTWQRHAVAARLAGRTGRGRVLDVGGHPGRLAEHLPGAEVVAINVRAPADVVFDGVTLPYPDGAFDLVTSLDVLEHLARPERAGHVAEVLRVAGERAVLCCPLGAPELNTAERELAEWYARLSGERSPFLDEHVINGLPSAAELHDLLAVAWPRFEVTEAFHGDFRDAQRLFRLEALAHFRGRAMDRARFLAERLRRPLRPGGLDDRPGPYSSRWFSAATTRSPARPSP